MGFISYDEMFFAKFHLMLLHLSFRYATKSGENRIFQEGRVHFVY